MAASLNEDGIFVGYLLISEMNIEDALNKAGFKWFKILVNDREILKFIAAAKDLGHSEWNNALKGLGSSAQVIFEYVLGEKISEEISTTSILLD